MTLALIYHDHDNETALFVTGDNEAWIRAELEKERIGYGWPAEECEIREVRIW